MSPEGPPKPFSEETQNLEEQGIIYDVETAPQPEKAMKERQKIIGLVENEPKIEEADKRVNISEEDRELITKTIASTEGHLEHNYFPGFGIFPSADRDENFYNQVWSRDLSHAAGNYFGQKNPKAVTDSLETIFKYQKPNGMLPLRVEREYLMMKLVPGLRKFSRPTFNFLETRLRNRKERPIFEGGDWGAAGAEDTIPSILVEIGEFFKTCKEGKQFAKDNFYKIEKAVDFFREKTDQEDGLAIMTRDNPDWADTLKRGGKLGGINVLWARGLRIMEFMSRQLGYEDAADKYDKEFMRVKKSVIEKLYNATEGYFRAKEGEDRVDATASIFGALYLLGPNEAVKVEETLKKRVLRNSGLQNFDPPYVSKEIFWWHRLMGKLAVIKGKLTGKKEHGINSYHNKFVWPWVTCQNIQVKIKIASSHKDKLVRSQYKKEAVQDFLKMTQLFEKLGGAYEVVDPEKSEPANIMFYKPPKNFMGSLSAYQGAYSQLKKLGWI
jgi:hypothetical protein